MNDFPFVSVIVPVFNDVEPLKQCLEALQHQTYDRTRYEVIVVDNGSEELQLIRTTIAQFDQASLSEERTPGSYAARNKGISLAKGTVIAFTDADCVPASDWIEQGVSHLLQIPNCGMVAGRITVFCQDPNRMTAVEIYESLTAFPQKQLLEQRRYGATANVFTFREVLDRVGLFNAELKSHGDVEWGNRVFAAGYQQSYSETTCVGHPARRSWQQLYQRTVRLAGGMHDLHQRQNASAKPYPFVMLKFLVADLIPPLMFVWNAFRDVRLANVEQKVKVSAVMFFVRYVTAWEKIRLQFGGHSVRA